MSYTRADYVFLNTPPTRAERIVRIDALASLLDTAVLIPGTNIRFGLDALIGLVPGIGDVVTTFLSLYIVKEARALGAPRHRHSAHAGQCRARQRSRRGTSRPVTCST